MWHRSNQQMWLKLFLLLMIRTSKLHRMLIKLTLSLQMSLRLPALFRIRSIMPPNPILLRLNQKLKIWNKILLRLRKMLLSLQMLKLKIISLVSLSKQQIQESQSSLFIVLGLRASDHSCYDQIYHAYS